MKIYFADDKVLARDFLSNFADVHGDPKYLKILVILIPLPPFPIPSPNPSSNFPSRSKMSPTVSSAPSRSSSMISSVGKFCSVQIELDVLVNYKDLDEEFLQRVTENTRRYISIFTEAVDELLSDPTEVFSLDDDHDILLWTG